MIFGRFEELMKEIDPMRSYVESESKRRQAVKRKFLNRTERRIRKWARVNLYFIGLTFSDPMIMATFMLVFAALVSALLLSEADFANPAIGMPTTISVFGLGIMGYNIGARTAGRTSSQRR